ncbi:MAG TPA: hypothetical protein VJT72_08905 [Pseudonocardiaceae bacterium]|nr:hypothetical protein [Pseudonocardiaceae bacterium]
MIGGGWNGQQSGSIVGGDNGTSRALLDEAGVSNAALARAVVAVGAEQGVHVGTSTTSVRRMLAGCQPRWPVPRMVATVLSRKLRYEVSVTDCGFVDRGPVAEDLHDGLHCSGTLDGTLRTVVELSGQDMRRRKFLLGSAFSAASFSEPALFALTVPPAESIARAGGRRVGMADVEILTEQVTQLRQLDYRYGSGRLREQVVSLLHREADQLLHGTYSAKTGKALLTAVAQATKLAGYTANDVGRHALAQRYFIQALDLAMAAGDRLYAANILGLMSHMTLQIGQNALTEYDRLRHGRQAVALARAGLAVAQGTATPGLAAELHAKEARGLALVGDVREAHRAVLAAQRSYESLRPDSEPPWQGLYTEAAFAADLGMCLRDLGESEQAITLSAAALRDYEPWRVRARCFAQIDLAGAHLLGRDFEQAAALGRDALRTAAQVSSTRTLDRLHTLQRQIQPLRTGSPHLRELDERITDFLTRSARSDGSSIAKAGIT